MLRWSEFEAYKWSARAIDRTTPTLLGLFALKAKVEARRAGLWFPDHFRGMAVSGHLTPIVLQGLIETLPEGVTEILCHPGMDNDDLSKSFDWGYEWARELDAVSDQYVQSFIGSGNLELRAFGAGTLSTG